MEVFLHHWVLEGLEFQVLRPGGSRLPLITFCAAKSNFWLATSQSKLSTAMQSASKKPFLNCRDCCATQHSNSTVKGGKRPRSTAKAHSCQTCA